MLGQIDVDTREWTDGVLTFSARQVVKEPGEVQSWIVCDGDIDPEWIESLNSVLDDNRSLMHVIDRSLEPSSRDGNSAGYEAS